MLLNDFCHFKVSLIPSDPSHLHIKIPPLTSIIFHVDVNKSPFMCWGATFNLHLSLCSRVDKKTNVTFDVTFLQSSSNLYRWLFFAYTLILPNVIVSFSSTLNQIPHVGLESHLYDNTCWKTCMVAKMM